ncbi:hypothetical protein DFH29DRAFT_800164 [Suillus ampliporus]|nr:hypothetical protein DFH29DRAFT_800164 [Suillus ampliporus]
MIRYEKEDYVVPAFTHPPELDPALTEQSEQSSEPRSNLQLFLPPLFSRQNVPQNYKRANPASIVTSHINEETGEERKRIINKG